MYKVGGQSCERCNKKFVCNVNDIKNCQCSQVKLSPETQTFLSKTNWGCLCIDCLNYFGRLPQRFHTTQDGYLLNPGKFRVPPDKP